MNRRGELEEPKRCRITVPLSQLNDPNLVYIGRQWSLGGYKLKKSVWHNPNAVKKYNGDRQACLDDYYKYFMAEESRKLRILLPSLAGKTMMCFCEEDELCHGDVISYVGEQLGLWVRK
jgi:hypothetical protein